jgi:dolichol-phosphate mannosyltransferase
MTESLWAVMPVYNEQDSVADVVREWLPVFRDCGVPLTICVLNDGSNDGTHEVIEALRQEVPELLIVNKSNTGHGQTCLTGYRMALDAAATWVFQLDSDGQCPAECFRALWTARRNGLAIYGYRRERDDGTLRLLLSRCVGLVGWVSFGVRVKDPNVPFRLMHRDALSNVVERIPSDLHLANVAVALFQEREVGIHWVDITFRERSAGAASVKGLAFLRRGLQLFRQLRELRSHEDSRAPSKQC